MVIVIKAWGAEAREAFSIVPKGWRAVLTAGGVSIRVSVPAGVHGDAINAFTTALDTYGFTFVTELVPPSGIVTMSGGKAEEAAEDARRFLPYMTPDQRKAFFAAVTQGYCKRCGEVVETGERCLCPGDVWNYQR